VSVVVQALPSLQAAPLERLVQLELETAGWQVWQPFAGLAAPEA